MKAAYKPAVRFAAATTAAFFAVSSIQAPTTAPACAGPTENYVPALIASGVTAHDNEKVALDASNVSEDYIMIKYTGSVGKIEVQITKSGSETYTYDLNSSGMYGVSPLSEGSGSYSVRVFENIQESQYPQAFNQNINISITNQFGPFLYPNQYVNFNAASAAMQTGASMTTSVMDQLGAVSNVYNYIISNVAYDTARASSIQSGYLPNMDVVLTRRKGICFNYATLIIVMLESQDIPTKLAVGYTGNLYHVWTNVYLEGQGWVGNIIYFDGGSWKLMDPTFVPSSGQSQEIIQYIGDDSDYRAKYSY